MNAFKQQCLELRKKDYTLPEIMRITGRSKTSVYFHIRNVALSERKLKEIRENTRKRALQIAGARKGKALRPHTPFTHWSPQKVLLIGHLIFDGEIIRGRCIYNNRSQALIKRVQYLMKAVYTFDPYVHMDPISGVVRLQYHNVALQAFLKDKAKELLRSIVAMPKTHQREFLRAFFDDEGCMDFRKDRNIRKVRGYQKDRAILELVQRLLKSFNINSKLQGTNEIAIISKENLLKFQKEINFSRGVRLNPNRTNSIWKRDIEKRMLLDMAIKSFKK